MPLCKYIVISGSSWQFYLLKEEWRQNGKHINNYSLVYDSFSTIQNALTELTVPPVCFKTTHRSEVDKLLLKQMCGRYQGEGKGGLIGSNITIVGVQTVNEPKSWYIKSTLLMQKPQSLPVLDLLRFFKWLFLCHCPKFLNACCINLAQFTACAF